MTSKSGTPTTTEIQSALPAAAGRFRAAFRRRGDLHPRPTLSLSWAKSDIPASLEALYRDLERRYLEAAEWYLRDKRNKSRWARGLRLLAILLTAAGGLFPILEATGAGHVNVNWGYVFIGLAASCIALDRFFGLSAGWMRDMVTSLSLQSSLAQLQMSWIQWNFGEDGPEVQGKIMEGQSILATYSEILSRTLIGETGEWVREFSARLNEADASSRRQLSEAADPAGDHHVGG
jgi:hypothetical protein